MKKHFLKSFALVAMLAGATTLSAQEYDVNFALTSNGATATATSGNAALAIDGNNGTRWESESADPQVFTLDLGQARQFNVVQILWEGAYGKTFTIEYSNDNNAWQTFASVEGQTLAGFPYTQTLRVDNTVTAQYVRFTGTERGTGWGYSFWEFRVLLATTSTLTTLTVTPDSKFILANETVALQVKAQDQNDVEMSDYGTIEYTVSPEGAGSVINGAYVPAKVGTATITAKVGNVEAEPFSIVCYEGENVALCTEENSKVLDYTGTNIYVAFDGNLGGGTYNACGTEDGTTGGDLESRTYDASFIIDLGKNYDVNALVLSFEAACSDAYTVYFAKTYSAESENNNWLPACSYNEVWGQHNRIDYYGKNDLQNNDAIRYVRFLNTVASTQYGVKLYEFQVFATETKGTTTLLDAVETIPAIKKTIENGQLVIIRDGVRYNVMGNEIR